MTPEREAGAVQPQAPPSPEVEVTKALHARVPVATYRLQFNRGFTFAQAAALTDYLRKLGIGDCYASPVFAARPGSVHGYDITRHSQISPEIGGEEELVRFAGALRERGLGLLLDVVPNHMCIATPDNPWWIDVLENGPGSPFARYFDIDWKPPKADLADKVLLPALGDQYGRVLENGEIRLVYGGGGFRVEYQQFLLPLAPRTWGAVLTLVLASLRGRAGESDPRVLELESILTALSHLPPVGEKDPEKIRAGAREKEIVRKRLDTLVESSEEVRSLLATALTELNGTKGDPRTFDRLEALLAEQAYRLCYWRVASDEINYRRFFDISDLAAIRVEDPDVFAAVHELPLRLIRAGHVSGLRLDHVDGLLEPDRYLADLQAGCWKALGESGAVGPALPLGGCPPGRPFYIVVEKILATDERLRREWPVHGTTGYEFLNLLNSLFVAAPNERAFRTLYGRFTGRFRSFPDVLYESKKLIMQAAMSSEVTVLARKLDRISEQHRWSRDFTLNSLQSALVEVIACFPAYRTYVRRAQTSVVDPDRASVLAAVRAARRRNPATSRSIFDFVGSVLLLEDPEGLDDAKRAERRDFVLRFQQLTSPIMAKGLEDTAFYRWFPLASLNEVGGDPDRFGVSIEAFHRRNRERLADSPHGLSATSTHDTKRGEDVRARINVLSEIPREWFRAVLRWRALNRVWKARIGGENAPDDNEEYLFYQTLLGAWPAGPVDAAFAGRIEEYMIKALKEAKVHTSWIDPDEVYERAARDFVRAVLMPGEGNRFLPDFLKFSAPVIRAGMLNSLSQTLLKIASPGVPDFYQGTELWDLNLVDPDNRRPVDFDVRRAQLDSLRDARVEDLLDAPEDGRIKMHVIARALACRRADPELFLHGAYVPLGVAGRRRRNVCAFARASGGRTVIAAAGRFVLWLGEGKGLRLAADAWGDTRLATSARLRYESYREVLTDREVRPRWGRRGWVIPVGELFSVMPVALLVGRS